jgi:pyruvate carboxylase
MKITKDGAEGLVILAAALGAAYVIYKAYKTAKAPVDAVSGAFEYLTGNGSGPSLGTDIYDWLNPPKAQKPNYNIPVDFGVKDPNAGW